MAHLDNLIAQVPDGRLRQEMERALAAMKRKQRFGLVYEDHLPEIATFAGLPVEPGALVERRDAPGSGILVVEALSADGATATVVPEGGGEAATVEVRDLLVARRFGEPIYPALTEVGEVRRGAEDRPSHAVINGENYHALQLLLYAYEGQVDCLYLDPPYNTGARDWKYNNRYVDANDAWRHSKWLSMMERRLRLARRLLKPDGVLIVTIDEHEVHHLGVLLEQVFPDYLRHMVSIVINPKGTGKLNFARVDEYALFCVPNTGTNVITGLPNVAGGSLFDEEEAVEEIDDLAGVMEESTDEDQPEDGDEGAESEDWPFPAAERDAWELRHARRRGGESSYRHQRPNQFYPIYVDPEALRVVRAGPAPPLEVEPDFSEVNGLKPIWPIDAEGNERCWRYKPESMQALIDEKRVRMGRYNPTLDSWTLNYWVRRPESKKLKTVWWETAHDAGTHGTTLLHKLLGRRGAFPFPKSVYAVADTLSAVVRNRPEALIVDFFGGSGTTLHATMLLNALDAGIRRCVLVTNNEVQEKDAKRLHADGHHQGDTAFEAFGIFEQATRPRTEAVVTGKRPDGTPIPGAHVGGRPFSEADYEWTVKGCERLQTPDPPLRCIADARHRLLRAPCLGRLALVLTFFLHS